jgi:hypothetical protein
MFAFRFYQVYIKVYISVTLVAQFKYLGKTVTNQNLIQKEIKKRLNSGNACCHSVQNRLPSRLVSKNVKIGTYKTIICMSFCMGVKFCL